MQDILVFHSKARAGPPGTGANEYVHPARTKDYEGLRAYPHWRKVLSNFDEGAPFKFQGHTYRSIEHAFQAQKIAIADGKKAFEFTVESGSPLGTGPALGARKARKLVVLTPAQLSAWDAISNKVMADIARAKYAADPHARGVLLSTGDAQLLHFMSRVAKGKNLVRFEHLEEIRDELRNQTG